MRFFSTLFAALLALVASAAQAQDPPGRVGRLAHTEGAVSVYMDPELGWEPGYVNTPITSENSVWTDLDSRAELRVGPMAIRLDEATQIDFSELDYEGVHARVERGAINVRIRHFLPNDRIAIDTPQARFVLLAEGRYRIDADPERGDSRLTVFSGRAVLETGRRQVAVGVGSSVVVWGQGRSSYAMQRAFTTPFDTWSTSLDSRWVESRAPQYVSTSMTGYEDLDRYGQWIQEPEYGPLWVPTRVANDWVPYRYGHWAWVRPWGWTWIDDQPWGYAPFHYGRWVHVRDRWAWYPGKRVERPVWAPALVAFVGGSNWSVGVRSGTAPVVGWYALSPFENYQPWYRANAAYVNNVNVNVTFTSRDRAYRYADRQREVNRAQAVTVVQRDAMLTRRNVQQAMVQVTPEAIRQQPVAQQPTAVLPSRNDVVRARAAAPQQAPATASAPPSAASTARSGTTAAAGTPPGIAPAAPAMPPPNQRPSFARRQAAPAPEAAPASVTPPPPAAVSRAVPPGQANSRFGAGAQPPAPGTPPSAKGQEAHERRDERALERDQQQAREAQQREQQRAQQEQERAAQQQRAQQEQQRGQQEKAAREAQAQQQRAQQEQQRAQQEKAARDAQAQQQRAQQEQQQRAQQEQQQRAQQEKAARDAQAQQQRAQQEQQQRAQQEQQQRAQQEKAARDAQAQQQRAQQEQQQRAQQEQQQRVQQEKAAREAQAQQQRAQQEQQQRAQQEQQRAQPQPAPPPARAKSQEEKDKEEKEKAEKEKGRGR